MASLSAACRLSARVAARQLPQNVARRGFRPSPASAAAQNFQMPALSPTMTEGNIASWKIKEGESFSAGDVLLEIETDKAQMDVEAQDDGILAKITLGDGSKAVKVGQRIGVLADPGDDLSSLEIPAEDNAEQKPSAPKEPKPTDTRQTSTPAPEGGKSAAAPPGKAVKQTHPLYPSVLFALRANGLSKDDADKIPATGPNGRLLKGDVLAYAGKLSESAYASTLSKILAEKAHLDLSNIKAVQPKPPAAAPATPAAAKESVPEPLTQVTLPINFKAVLECQKRLQDTLGVYLPLSDFVARATELANEELPRSKNAQPSADELFNAIVGTDKIPTTSRGHFIPEVSALPTVAPKSAKATKPLDIFDILAGKPATTRSTRAAVPSAAAVASPINVFSVSVPKGEEKRATVFLERVKVVLETQPGELVL